MSSTNTLQEQNAAPLEATHDCAPPVAQQLLYTHCAKDDSVVGKGGFSVRATSDDNADLLHFADELPNYSVPLSVLNGAPDPRTMPIRLALLDAPHTPAAVLMHSNYVERDTKDRLGNFFSHILVYNDRLDLASSLQAWGSPMWRDHYLPGETQQLPTVEGYPAAGELNDAALQWLLNGTPPTTDDEHLSTVLTPLRIGQQSNDQRHNLLVAMMTGCLKCLHDTEADKKRVYINAEPGLVALLLYGVARLLPGKLLQGLRYSTYEPPGESLRSFKLADIVGTYNEFDDTVFPGDFLERRGNIIDTFTGRIDEELLQPRFASVSKLMALAQNGEWSEIETIHELAICDEPLTEQSLDDAVQLLDQCAAVLSTAIDSGEDAAQEDTHSDTRAAKRFTLAERKDALLSLHKNDLGQVVLRNNVHGVWRDLWEVSVAEIDKNFPFLHKLTDVTQQQEFRDAVLAESLRLLFDEQSTTWLEYWSLWKHVSPKGSAKEEFLQLLESAKLPSIWEKSTWSLRKAFLLEWQTLIKSPGAIDHRHLPDLLLVSKVDEYKQFRQTGNGLPDAWVVQMLAVNLNEEFAALAVEQLFESPEKTLTEFCQVISRRHDAAEALQQVLSQLTPDNLELLFRLRDAGLSQDLIQPEILDQALQGAKVWRKTFDGWWQDPSRLGEITQLLSPESVVLKKVWRRCSGRFDRSLLLNNRAEQQRFADLQTLRHELGSAVPVAAGNRLDEWDEALARLEKASPVPSHWPAIAKVALGVLVTIALGAAVGWFAQPHVAALLSSTTSSSNSSANS